MEQPFQPLNNLPLTTLVAGGSKIGGSEGRLKEGGAAAGFAREKKEASSNVGNGINEYKKGRGAQVRYFPPVRGEQGVHGNEMRTCEKRSGNERSAMMYCFIF